MAEYITANRWITGVATHKTKHGRILCTGFGCIGCYPQDFPDAACELEVYDSQTGLLFAESWTNEVNNESVMETTNKIVGPQCHFRKTPLQNNEFKTKQKISVGDSTNENKLSGEFKVEKVFLTEYVEETEGSKSETMVETKAIKKENCTENFPTTTENTDFKRIFPLGLQKYTENTKSKVVELENSVCLFFALEHQNQSNRLSNFTILEIVNSLTTLMHVNEIKCVQRLNGLWHIALRTSKHLRYLLTNGLNIRGRCYRVVKDNDMYCEKVH